MQEQKKPQVVLAETPSEKIINHSELQAIIHDDRGRKIVLKKPNILRQYKLVEMLGESSKNEVYMRMVLPMLFVESIDDINVVLSKKSELEALITRLDENGVNAVMLGVAEKFGANLSEETEKEQIKK